jgi:molybdate transport system ATP-binding protein
MGNVNGGTVFELRGKPDAAFFAGASWRFRRGEQWIVTGPNGSGKSRLAALLAGEIPARGVEIAFGEGVEDRVALVTFAQQREQAAHGWLQSRWHWQDAGDAVTVRRFLSYDAVNEINPFEIRGAERAERRAFALRLRTVAGLFDLAPLRSRLTVQLSNGEMRRVLLARALLKRPALLVLDDPFAGLDPAMRERLKTALDRLARDGLPMVLMVRHGDEVPGCATHRLTLKEGLKFGSSKVLKLKKPENPVSSMECPISKDGPTLALPHFRTLELLPPLVIELRNVTVRYGRRVVLDKLNWIVRAGERWLVAGPNGSGKTTLLSLITGDNPAAYANDVRVFGRSRVVGESLWPVRRRIGQVSPELQCYFDDALPCLDAVLSGRVDDQGELPRPTRAARAAAREWLRRFGLEGTERTPFGALSAGRQRLVLLARAMLPEPELLLLDEPCLNLDGASRRLVLGVLERLLKVRKTETVVCVAHRPDDVPRGFTRTLRL